jgi:hypothetical protein
LLDGVGVDGEQHDVSAGFAAFTSLFFVSYVLIVGLSLVAIQTSSHNPKP